MSAGGPRPRRRPQQDRSRETVERVLAAAETEIAEVGLAGASTTRIARRAGLSVGALYRFFPDKDAVAEALAARYLEEVSDRYAVPLAAMAGLTDLRATVDALVLQAGSLQLAHPGYYRLTEELDPHRTDSPAHQVREKLVDQFVAALQRGAVAEPEGELRRVVGLCVETVRHTLVRAPAGGPERDRVLADLAEMVGAYLAARFG